MFDHLDKATSLTESEAQAARRVAAEVSANENNIRQQAYISWRQQNITLQLIEQLKDAYETLNIQTESSTANIDILRAKTIEKATLRKVISCITNNKQYEH